MMSTSRKQKLKKRAAKLAAWKSRRQARELHMQRQREGRFAPFFNRIRQLDELYMDVACQHKAPSLFDLLDELEIDFIAVPSEDGAYWRVYAAAEYPGVRMASSIGWVQDELLAALQAAPRLKVSAAWARLLGLPPTECRTAPAELPAVVETLAGVG